MGLSSRIEHRRTGAGLFDQGPIANLLHTLKSRAPITGGPYIEKPKVKLAVEPSEFAKKVRSIKGSGITVEKAEELLLKQHPKLKEQVHNMFKNGTYLKHHEGNSKWVDSKASREKVFQHYLAHLNEEHMKKKKEEKTEKPATQDEKDLEIIIKNEMANEIKKHKLNKEHMKEEKTEKPATQDEKDKRKGIMKEIATEILEKLHKKKQGPIQAREGDIPAAPGTKGSKAFELTATSFGKIIAKPQKAEFKSILKNFFSANGYTEFSKVPDVLVTAVNELGLVKHVTPEILDTLKGILNNFRAISTAVPVVAATPEATPIIIRKKTATHTRSVPKKKPPPIKRGTVRKLPKKSKGETPHKKLQKTIKFVI